MHIVSAKSRENVGLEKWAWRQIVTSQTAHTKYKWLPYATEWNSNENVLRTPLSFGAYDQNHTFAQPAVQTARWS